MQCCGPAAASEHTSQQKLQQQGAKHCKGQRDKYPVENDEKAAWVEEERDNACDTPRPSALFCILQDLLYLAIFGLGIVRELLSLVS